MLRGPIESAERPTIGPKSTVYRPLPYSLGQCLSAGVARLLSVPESSRVFLSWLAAQGWHINTAAFLRRNKHEKNVNGVSTATSPWIMRSLVLTFKFFRSSVTSPAIQSAFGGMCCKASYDLTKNSVTRVKPPIAAFDRAYKPQCCFRSWRHSNNLCRSRFRWLRIGLLAIFRDSFAVFFLASRREPVPVLNRHLSSVLADRAFVGVT